ncbi:ADP-ribosyltransferase [Streptomyces sp. Li-HN-5-11]|uniref:ADP-ribosyltransferase n=1 Tax=Streptomyces sp. Li-HN-5-11 TaxID=3075432 RepID=UPI0028AD2797|nr:ADP-ribosyltransferase [Streptomyces sp. Li-HN-5-11]WNM35150.1 ADP-ribosyltransferase [Streptomyces sp. Li-HN-5-11]
MIDPEKIPQFTGDLAQLEKDCADLKADAGHVRDTGREVHNRFQGLAAYYHAPEAEQLFATTKPVRDRADGFAGDLETVSGALESYATEVRPLVKKLADLKTEASAFVASVKDDGDWEYDGDKVAHHNRIRDEVTQAVAAFWAAERTCHNKITSLWHGTQMVAGDGSKRKDQYGFNADDLKNAKLPWGDPVEEKHHWYEIGHWVKSFVWDGIVVDGIWGTIKGLGTLVGCQGWDAMGRAWKGLAQLATGLTLSMGPLAGVFWALPDKDLPSWFRESRNTMKQTGKALVAWDEWGKNPARAAGAVTFNVLTTVFTGGEGAAAAGAGKAGAVAKALSVAGKAGRIIDPMTYVAKGAGAGLSKIGDIAKGLKGVGKIDIPSLPDGSVHLPDGRLLDPHGNIMAHDGVVETTPIPHEPTPKLPDHWTIQGQQPAYASAAHTADSGIHGGVPHTASNGIYGGIPHSAGDSVPTGATHAAGDGIHGGMPHSPGGGIHGGMPHSGNGIYGGIPHSAGGGIHGGIPHSAGNGIHGGIPHSAGDGIHGGIPHSAGDGIHGGVPTSYEHAPTVGAPHDVPSPAHDVPNPAHDAPATTPHTGGHTPDTAPHGPGHDTTPGAHPHDTSHGAGHDGAGHDHHGASHEGTGHDGAGHDGAHAGDHGGVPHDGVDTAAHDGADPAAAHGHPGTDAPGHEGAGEPFEYKPLVSDAEWDKLDPAQQHKVAYAEISDGTVAFPTDKEAIQYGQAYWNHYAENMPEVERKAVWDYTDEPDYNLPAPHPDGWGTYKEMNGYLRGDASKLTPYVQHNIDEVDKALAGHPVPDDVMVVRGTDIGHLHLDDPLEMLGNTYGDPGYLSTSLGNHPVSTFAGKDAILHLRVPKGTPALWVEKVGKYGMGERELLLGRGTQYRVTRVFMENGQVQVYGEVLPR